MSVPTATSILVELGETFFSYGLPPLSILTVCGAFKGLRNPWIRGSAFVFTATTQALWERDLQIEHRRALVQHAQNINRRMPTWVMIHEKFKSFQCESSGVGWPLKTELKEDGSSTVRAIAMRYLALTFGSRKELHDQILMWDISNEEREILYVLNLFYFNLKELHDEILMWDMNHGQREILYRINTLYSSNAIFLKSLVCGITLGALPVLLKAPVCVTDYWNYQTKDKKPTRIFLEISADDTFNRCYAWVVGSRPFLDPSHRAIINWMHSYALVVAHKVDLQATARWYSRKGKLPVFQYNVEEESS